MAQKSEKIHSPIDVEVGARIRTRRKLLGMSQTILADGLGVSFQQVQKYERGSNRVGSSRLQKIAQLLGTTPAALFGEDNRSSAPALVDEFTLSHEAIALNKAFPRIADRTIRRSVIALVKSLGNDD